MRCRTCADSLKGISPTHELFGVFAALEQWDNDSVCTQVELPLGHLSLINGDADGGTNASGGDRSDVLVRLDVSFRGRIAEGSVASKVQAIEN